MSAVPFLQFAGVTKQFGALDVVGTPFNLDIPIGQFLVFLGPSGCGKTTLMRMIGGLDRPTSGEIRLEGRPVGAPSRRRGMVFQSYSSFPWLTVAANVAFGMRYRRDLDRETKRARAAHYLALVGLTDCADLYPNQISGGMRQRVAIARTLAAGSDVLLMDEPFGALDAQRREGLQYELRRIHGSERRTIVFVTHDVEEAIYLADRIIVFSGRPTAIVADLDIAGELGIERPLALRETAIVQRLRSEILTQLRH